MKFCLPSLLFVHWVYALGCICTWQPWNEDIVDEFEVLLACATVFLCVLGSVLLHLTSTQWRQCRQTWSSAGLCGCFCYLLVLQVHNYTLFCCTGTWQPWNEGGLLGGHWSCSTRGCWEPAQWGLTVSQYNCVFNDMYIFGGLNPKWIQHPQCYVMHAVWLCADSLTLFYSRCMLAPAEIFL